MTEFRKILPGMQVRLILPRKLKLTCLFVLLAPWHPVNFFSSRLRTLMTEIALKHSFYASPGDILLLSAEELVGIGHWTQHEPS